MGQIAWRVTSELLIFISTVQVLFTGHSSDWFRKLGFGAYKDHVRTLRYMEKAWETCR
jgi:hypothetical protein